jgi:hypothetical protein
MEAPPPSENISRGYESTPDNLKAIYDQMVAEEQSKAWWEKMRGRNQIQDTPAEQRLPGAPMQMQETPADRRLPGAPIQIQENPADYRKIQELMDMIYKRKGKD